MEVNSNRLVSLDVFRGITIAGMILVNDPGDWGNVYPALRHAVWNGCTPTDLVFPFFLFIVGVSITLSLSKRKERGDDQTKLIFQIIKRSVIIFLIGLLLNGFPNYNLATIRIPGVLQRIAVVYFVSSLLFLKTNWKTQALSATVLLILYWIIISVVPVPGFGSPYLAAPTLINPYSNQLISPNIAGWLDSQIFGAHLWSNTRVWDPEGLLSTIPAIATGIIGMLLGQYLRIPEDKIKKTVLIFVFANIALVAGIIWDIFFPMNKGIWTSSYVLFTCGLALHFFAMCFWLTDIKGIKWWTKPFVVFGTNAITAYALSEFGAMLLYTITLKDALGRSWTLSAWLFNKFFVPFFSPINASLAWAVVYVLFCLSLVWILYSKKIFIKV